MTTSQSNSTDWILSIDFGTSSTVAAITHADGRSEILEIDGERRAPSVVLVDDDHSLVVGASAVGLAASRPERTIRAPKRRLGDQTPVILGGKPFSPVDLVAALLRFVRTEAEQYVGSAPSAVRLTHPATWTRPLQQRLLEAAAKAGMPDVGLVPEPVAAAMAAADRTLPVGSYIAVYDLGGGTFDTTVVQSTERGYIVVGHPIGDRQIGGELFDEALMNHVGSRLEPEVWEQLQASEERDWRQASARLLSECRRVKESLSNHGYGEIVVGTPGGMIDERVTRDELEAIVAPYLDASVDLLERCVDDVGIEPSQLAAIHMIGGASRMPLAAAIVESAFPGVEVSRRGDPRTAVAAGAALVELDTTSADVIADKRTTVERRVRSIDTEAAAIDAAAATAAAAAAAGLSQGDPTGLDQTAPDRAPTVAPTTPATDPRPAHEPPTQHSPVDQPAHAAAFTPAGATTPHPLTAPTATTPITTTPITTTPPPGAGGTAASNSGPDNTPLLVVIGLLVVAVIGFGAFVFTRGDDSEPELAEPTTSTPGTQGIASDTSALPPSPESTTTTPPPSTSSTSTTVAPSTTISAGPTSADAQEILLDLRDLPEGWQNGSFDPQPIQPCGQSDPFTPVFVEGRTFDRNVDQANASSISHSVSIYATAAEAAAVVDYYQAFAGTCPFDQLTVDGITFDAAFISCDPFATCPQPLPASQAELLSGDQFALQLALLEEPVSGILVTDQVYVMQVGRSIVQFEYVTLGEPSDDQLSEAGNTAVAAWAMANALPR